MIKWSILLVPIVVASSSSFWLSDAEEELAMETIPLHQLHHRQVENYTAEFLANLTQSDREILLNQIDFDARNDIFAPAEDDSHGPPQEYTPLGTIELGESIHKGDQSALFEIRGHSELLIKYQANCDDLDSSEHLIHPLIRDYWYMRESFDLGLSPEPLFLSPPSLFSKLFGVYTDRKYLFKMDVFTASECADQGGVIRYMIMKKSRGESLYVFRNHFRKAMVPLNVAAQITASVIDGLRRLHDEAHIVHGDIHTGNIMVELTDVAGEYQISFIDFGRAFRDGRNSTNDRVHAIGYWSHYLCSPWQIDGRVWARRDDVYKAIQTFAIITNPAEYTIREEHEMHARGIEGAIAMKLNRFMFQMAQPVRTQRGAYISIFDPVSTAARFDLNKRDRLVNELGMIQELVTVGVDDINADIRYDEIIQRLKWVESIASSRHRVMLFDNNT